MPDRTYKLTYVVDASQALPALKNVHAAITAIDQAAKKGQPSIDTFGHAIERLKDDAAMANLHLQQSAEASNNLSHSLGGFLPAWQVFDYGVQLAMKFGEYMNSAREHMRELAGEAQTTRDKMRELANLKGHAGPDNEVVAGTVQMAMEAGLGIDEATKFMEQFEGSIPAGRAKGNIDRAIEKDLAIEGMKFGNRVALQPGTAGDITGVLAQYGKIGSVYDGADQLGSIAHGLNEGRGNLEPLMRSLLKTAGSIVEENGGPVEDLPQLAAMLGVASTNATPDRAGTMLKNAVGSLRKFKGSQGESLRALGITPQMKFHEALSIIAPKIVEADQSGIGGDTYLRNSGFDNEDEIRGLLQLSRNKEVIDQRLEETKAIDNGRKVMEANQKFLTQDRAGISRSLKARKEGADFLAGEKREFAEMGIAAGSEDLRNQGWTAGFGNHLRFFAKDLGGILPMLGVEDAKTSEAKGQFMQMLDKEAVRVGVDPSKNFSVSKDRTNARDRRLLYGTQLASHPDLFFGDTAGLNATIEQVMEAGGNPFGDSAVPDKRFNALSEHDQEHRARLDQIPVKMRGLRQRIQMDPAPQPGPAAAGPRPAQPGPGADLGGKLDKLVAATDRTNQILQDKLAAGLPDGASTVGAARL